jgi:NADH-quinone oxidoreductase subunit E
MSAMNKVPGWGIAMGMLTTLVRFVQPKHTVQYPEVVQEISPKHRGRLILLYDERGNLKCETCFQCAAACPIEIIDMGGVDTKNRYFVHWGPPEQYAERREESAVRRSGRPVPDRTFVPFDPIDVAPLNRILDEEDYEPARMLAILEKTQAEYGHLPVAALKHISHTTGAWYARIYGTATSYEHLRFEVPATHVVGVCRCPACLLQGGGRILESVERAAGTRLPGTSLDGAIRLEAIDCHGGSPTEPYVMLDGAVQTGVTPDSIADVVTGLRAAAAPAGRA